MSLVIGAVVLLNLNPGTPVAQGAAGTPSPSGSAASPSATSAPGVVASSTGTPLSSGGSSSTSVRQLPILGADAALAYHWAPDKNYDYDYQLNATVDGTLTIYGGNATYKLNPRTTEQLARMVGADGPQEGSGTAFVVHSDGLLVTCAHVVRGATKVSVTIQDRTYPGDVVGVDDRHDLALIRVAASNLPAVPLGNSDSVQLAEEVRAVGFPLSNVLGTSVKITRGTIAGIVTKNGDRLLQIDASINPGNSGGPLFNDRGEVVGINSSGLFGESIASVGFAVPSNYALALLRSKGIAPTAASGNKVLAGTVLASTVIPAVAFVKVDMGKSESLQILEYNGFCMKTGSEATSRPSTAHDKGRLLMVPTGEVLQNDAEAQMPLLMMPLSEVAIIKLPSDGDREWESRRVTVMLLPDNPRDSISPFGPGGMSRPGRNPRSPIGRPQTGVVLVPAVEQIKYKIASETAEVMEIEKTLDISSMDAEGGKPGFQITGRGNITWDKKHGAPRLIKQTMTMAVSAGGAKASAPLELKVELYGVTTDAERPEMIRKRADSQRSQVTKTSKSTANQPPKFSTSPPVAPTLPSLPRDTLDEHLAVIKGKTKAATVSEVGLPLVKIAFLDPIPSRRDEVSALLDPFLQSQDESVRRTALMAVAKWGTQKNVPSLLELLESIDPVDRGASMKALGSIGGNKEAATAVAKRMSDAEHMSTAADALQAMGPIAEVSVWQHVGSSNKLLHSRACQVLGAIGTATSVAKFQPLIKKETDIGHRVPMESALREIQKRLGK